ncbi:AAA family ATPase [Aminirod propionatiphilus]|uniref:AAA family ATPase n=1 Tax=Aminirod propionatiphilus TaxID=3415223 RepID=A0ACD1DXJ1_9BACT|nr:AAA family ATPase [Synergistota bacterium]
MTLNVQLLGPPRFSLDGVDLVFPFRKVEGLACYLFVERQASRETLMDLLWSDKEGEAASRNLRNALYELRKVLPQGLIRNRGQRVVAGDEGFCLDLSALDVFPSSSPTVSSLRPFMEGFSLPACPPFEEWLRQSRSLFELRRRRAMRDYGRLCLDRGTPDRALSCLESLFASDVDEEAGCLLMEAYSRTGRRCEMIRTYRLLTERLASELDLGPSEETIALYGYLLLREGGCDGGGRDLPPEGGGFFGRQVELESVRACTEPPFDRCRAIFVSGEAGVGKSLFVSRALGQAPPGTLVVTCGAARGEERHPLLPWNDLLEGVAARIDLDGLDFPPAHRSLLAESFPALAATATSCHPAGPFRLGAAMARLFDLLARFCPVAIVFEDLQWFDGDSLDLLESFLAHRRAPLLLFVTTRHSRSCRGRDLFRSAARVGRCELKEIALAPFSRGETESFCRLCLPGRDLAGADFDRLYGQTDGLPLFLSGVIRLLAAGRSLDEAPSSLAETYERLLADFSDEDRFLLERLSVFSTRAEWGLLRRFSGLSEAVLTERVERLRTGAILAERLDEGERLHIEFSHVAVRDHIYRSLSEARRRLLHGELAHLLMEELGERRWNDLLCSRIIGHCRRAALATEELDYSIRRLKLHIHLNYELFPLLSDDVLRGASAPLEGRKDTREQLAGLEELLRRLRREGTPSARLERLEASFRALSGGYRLWWGDYVQGKLLVAKALEEARRRRDGTLELEALQHLCYYAIQTEEPSLLERHSRSLLESAGKARLEALRGVALRFLGMARLFRGEYDGAERALEASIDRFRAVEALDEPYTLQTAAARNYLADSAHRRGRLDEALDLYGACVGQCRDEGLFRGLCLFHSNAAHVAFDLGDDEAFLRHLEAARSLQEESEAWRGNGILFSLLAWDAAREGEEERALTALRRGDALVEALGKRFWLALQLEVKGRIKAGVRRGGLLDEALTETPETYRRGALSLYRAMAVRHKAKAVTEAAGMRGGF